MAKIKSFTKTYVCDKPHYPFELPKGWVWTTVGEITNYGDSVNVQIEDIDNSDWVLELEDIEKDTANIIQHLNKNERKINGTRHKFQKGQILYSKLRTYLNKVLVAPNDGFCTTEIMAFGSYGILSNNYICYVLRSLYFLDYTLQCGYGVKMPRLSTTDACNGLIPLPPLAEQERIVNEIQRLFSIIDIVENGKDGLQTAIQQAKNKILDLAIHGKLVPQDPNDEPASELLKRINPKAEITCDNPQYGKLPKGWCETLLGNIGNWQSGATPSRLRKDYYNGDIHWLKTGDLNDGVIKSIPETITRKALEETSVKLNPIGSVLIAMYGATIGKIGILALPATTNQACCACVDYICDKMFLFYFLLANRERFIAMGGGGAQPNISKEKITNTHIPLPPLSEQHRIVAKIEELFVQFDKIESSL